MSDERNRSLSKRANGPKALPAARSAALTVTTVARRYVHVQFVSGLRARIAEHLVRRWEPRPQDGEAAVPSGSACRALVSWPGAGEPRA